MAKDIAIAVKGISKDFHMSSDSRGSFKDLFVHPIASARKKAQKSHHVLKDISFEIEEGEFFGIVGRNGSGKSTLLKILANIYQPTSGSVTINGRLVSFIELGVGFNPDLTGKENVYLNGALMGFSTKEIDTMYDEIVEFAELEEFMDEKLKNYSSGMQVRLAFSVATRSKSDILVLDEVLAVGDEAFQRKCESYFMQVKKKGKTIILVTHSMENVRKYCSRAMLITSGEVEIIGNPDKVATAYSNNFDEEYKERLSKQRTNQINQKTNGGVSLGAVYTTQDKKKTAAIQFENAFSINLEINARHEYKDVIFAAHIVNQAGHNIAALVSKPSIHNINKGNSLITFNIDNILAEGEYYLNVGVLPRHGGQRLIQATESATFSVIGMDRGKHSPYGTVYPKFSVKVRKI